MNRTAITALRRLRQYELEKEEWKLQARQREEMDMLAVCTHAQNRLGNEMLVDIGTSALDWKRRADGVRELGHEFETAQRQFRLAQQARNEQIQAVLNAKRRVEIVDRLLERDDDARRAERDQIERKLLDDLAAGRATQPEFAGI
ncbi:MAG: hypothetical protein B9S32_10355 [Verrucomicrobia bacterium Tous-C9LFEB]|nr:MAG: hypothetical protein B9S32_10355 [Verrucomicrobia bacterium Tous-C9LFEB]